MMQIRTTPLDDLIAEGDCSLRELVEQHKSDLWSADLIGARLTGVNLEGAHLRHSDISDAGLRGANLRDANLWEAYGRGANLEGADLSDANMKGARLPESVLCNARLRRANLVGASLESSDLSGADLSEASLRSANLHGTRLRLAVLSGATMPDGRPWEEYQRNHLAGICDDHTGRQIVIDAWGNPNWTNGPMHELLQIRGLEAIHEKDLFILVACWSALYEADLLQRPSPSSTTQTTP